MSNISKTWLYIPISFTPWIIYWVLCSFNYELGVLIPFIISLALLAIKRNNLNLIDLTSFIYFTVAITTTFIFNIDIFIEKSGFLGYSALFLMAFLSLVFKHPYTLEISKREYPKVYWKDKMFLIINSIITAAWASIFLLNALIFLLTNTFTAVITSNMLVILGIVLSIILPIKVPTYLVLRNFKKYDWNIRVDPTRAKGEDEYDVIVVGSGIGGLTCGALLTKWGYKVLVLEQHYLVGGYCSSFARDKYIFNTGVSDVSGLWERGPVSYLLNQLGLRREELFTKNKMRIIFKDREINVENLDQFINTLVELFPEEQENIHAFFNEAKKAYEECYKDLNYGVPLPAELIAKVLGTRALTNYPREHPHFYDWMNKTYKQKLDEFFTNEDLKTLLCALLGYLGTRPEETPASSALTAVVSYYLYGGYFPRGGAQRFADSLKNFIEKNGGKVLVNHKVDKILVEKGEVRGVKVGNKIFKSPIVVANANAKTVFLELVGEEHLDKDFVEYIRKLKMSPSAFMVFLGVDMDLTKYPTIIQNLDDGYSIVINSNADPDLAPRGKASVTIMTLANYHDYPHRNTKEYLEKKRKDTETLIQKAEKIIPNLSKHIVIKDSATPKTFERYTSMPEGAIYSFDQSINTKRPYFKTPIRGLYLASASTFPGGGIEAVVISGIICAHDITGWKHKIH